MDEDLRDSDPADEARDARIAQRLQLETRVKSGANWFYWIAALSLVNSAVVLAQGDLSFFIGLGITQLVDGFALGLAGEAPDAGVLFKAIAVVLDLVAVGLCAGAGFLASKRKSWAFKTGMTLYALDGLIFLPFGDFFSFGFHIFALFGMYGGLKALNEMIAIDPTSAPPRPAAPRTLGQAPPMETRDLFGPK